MHTIPDARLGSAATSTKFDGRFVRETAENLFKSCVDFAVDVDVAACGSWADEFEVDAGGVFVKLSFSRCHCLDNILVIRIGST